jgi:hypothetical protein
MKRKKEVEAARGGAVSRQALASMRDESGFQLVLWHSQVLPQKPLTDLRNHSA